MDETQIPPPKKKNPHIEHHTRKGMVVWYQCSKFMGHMHGFYLKTKLRFHFLFFYRLNLSNEVIQRLAEAQPTTVSAEKHM